jgi:hypothetical protein
MKAIALKPIVGTQKVLDMLEKKGAIRCLKPSRKLAEGKCKWNIETHYTTAPQFGTHKLMAVLKDSTQIALTTHPDNEDIILINNTGKKYKPLYLITALMAQKKFEAKARAGTLSVKDVVAVKLQYNASTSVFTVLKDIPHCEITGAGKGPDPVFFVTEPADFKMEMVAQAGYSYILSQEI